MGSMRKDAARPKPFPEAFRREVFACQLDIANATLVVLDDLLDSAMKK